MHARRDKYIQFEYIVEFQLQVSVFAIYSLHGPLASRMPLFFTGMNYNTDLNSIFFVVSLRLSRDLCTNHSLTMHVKQTSAGILYSGINLLGSGISHAVRMKHKGEIGATKTVSIRQIEDVPSHANLVINLPATLTSRQESLTLNDPARCYVINPDCYMVDFLGSGSGLFSALIQGSSYCNHIEQGRAIPWEPTAWPTTCFESMTLEQKVVYQVRNIHSQFLTTSLISTLEISAAAKLLNRPFFVWRVYREGAQASLSEGMRGRCYGPALDPNGPTPIHILFNGTRYLLLVFKDPFKQLAEENLASK